MAIKDQLRAYFDRNEFDETSYTAPTFDLNIGPWVVTMKNPPPRQSAIRIHDVNHVLTGYPTTLKGETEIGAYELGSFIGGDYPMAWLFNCVSTLLGCLRWPLSTLAAFTRGWRSKSLYRRLAPGDTGTYNFLLLSPVNEIRDALSIPRNKTRKNPLLILPLLAYATVGLTLSPMLALPVVVSLIVSRRRKDSL